MRRRQIITLITILVVAFGSLAANLIAGNSPSLGLDLQGGASVTLEPREKAESDAIDVAVEIIRKRVDSIGVAEPEIIRQGDTVVVNLPGVKDQQSALNIVGRTGEVQLRPVIAMSVGDASTTTLAPSTSAPAASSTLPGETTTTTSTTTTTTTTTTTVPATTTTLPENEGGIDAALPAELSDKDGYLYSLGPSGGSGEVFKNDAKADISSGSWVVVVSLQSGAEGTGKWNALAAQCFDRTASCPSGQLAIVLDGLVISAPTVQERQFTGGSVQITGDFKEKEAKDLAKILQFGAVPVRFNTPTAQTVSATLGKDSLNAALLSGLVGVLLVLLFLVLYYGRLALIVVLGLGVSGSILWSVISLLSQTNGLALTLSGAAGIIVSIGVTVDSYVVFFERLKDEVRSGKTLRNSAQRGFDSAWKTILAADTVSLLGALVLWYLTVGSVRGFAFFLGLSTLCDMIVAYYFTRPAVVLISKTGFMNRGKQFGIEAATS